MRHLKETVEREKQKALDYYKRLVNQHMSNLRSVSKLLDTSGITTVPVEDRLQDVYARCSKLGHQAGECPEGLRE